jgi:hypothetical protein
MKDLYDAAKFLCHEAGIDWHDPRTGEVHKSPCSHENVTRLPGITNDGVKISVCRDCGEQIEEDV